MDIRFPGGLRVDAVHEGFSIRTDQPVAQTLRFCQQRNLDTEGLALSITPERDTSGKRVARIRIEIALPSDFPAKYREAILRAVDQCAVKRHLAEPPQFDVVAVETREKCVPPWARVTPPPAWASSPRSEPS